jgi:coenzyme F420-reducing hydrogenase gamma subunit
MTKPKVAIFDFACCEGCQLQIVNLEEDILNLLNLIEPVEWREAMAEQSETYDIAIIEGSITRPEDEQRLYKIRERAKVLIAIGACAHTGGVNKLKNNFELNEVKRFVYKDAAGMAHLNTAAVKAVHEVVKVDYTVPGCPIDRGEFGEIIRALIMGRTPVIPDQPVCVECKRKDVTCRYLYNEVCLGPVTLAGCGARCPSKGHWCYGCRGYVADPNVNAAKDVMELYGRTPADLKSRMRLFGSGQPGSEEETTYEL